MNKKPQTMQDVSEELQKVIKFISERQFDSSDIDIDAALEAAEKDDNDDDDENEE